MDFLGLIKNYKRNRPLDAKERFYHLDPERRINVTPRYQLSIIKMNSVYLETVDKWFAWRGVIAMIGIAIVVVGGFTLGIGAVYWLLGAAGLMNSPIDRTVLFWNGLAMAVVAAAVSWAGIWLLRKDAFSYTHYPMRFNRKTKMVHVFRTDGTVLSVAWRDVFFTLGHLVPGNNWEVRGHVLASDRITVLDTFALSHVDVLSESQVKLIGTDASETDFVRAHWEFIRRYMEEGPQELQAQVAFCMPIDSVRERIDVSFRRAFANFSNGPKVLGWIMSPVTLILGIFRVFAVRTSRVPKWPEEIESTSVVESGDPYAIRGEPDGTRVAVYPQAAAAAGVHFQQPGRN